MEIFSLKQLQVCQITSRSSNKLVRLTKQIQKDRSCKTGSLFETVLEAKTVSPDSVENRHKGTIKRSKVVRRGTWFSLRKTVVQLH